MPTHPDLWSGKGHRSPLKTSLSFSISIGPSCAPRCAKMCQSWKAAPEYFWIQAPNPISVNAQNFLKHTQPGSQLNSILYLVEILGCKIRQSANRVKKKRWASNREWEGKSGASGGWSDGGKHQERMKRHGTAMGGERKGFKWRKVPFYSAHTALSFL